MVTLMRIPKMIPCTLFLGMRPTPFCVHKKGVQPD